MPTIQMAQHNEAEVACIAAGDRWIILEKSDAGCHTGVWPLFATVALAVRRLSQAMSLLMTFDVSSAWDLKGRMHRRRAVGGIALCEKRLLLGRGRRGLR